MAMGRWISLTLQGVQIVLQCILGVMEANRNGHKHTTNGKLEGI